MQIDGFKNFKYCHHHEFHKPNHTHANTGGHVEVKKSGTREIKVVRRVLDVNEKMAQQNRDMFSKQGVFVLNVMSSPGSGKTTLLKSCRR